MTEPKKQARARLGPVATLTAATLLTACQTAGQENGGTADDSPELYRIAAETVPCVGVGPQRCLVINNTLFYDGIDGYEHVEGQAAEICVERSNRPEPVPADASIYLYKRVDCP